MSTADLAEKIKHYRNAWGLTQEQLAELLDVNLRTLQRWEAGENSRTKRPQTYPQLVTLQEDQLKRRDFFRTSLAVSLTFAIPIPEPIFQQLEERISPAAASPSINEEISIATMLTKTYWQFLPFIANKVDKGHLAHIQKHRLQLSELSKRSPGSMVDKKLRADLQEAIGEAAIIEATLLYSLGETGKATDTYKLACKALRESNNRLLEAIGLTWFSNFWIDIGLPREAADLIGLARSLSHNGGASDQMKGWVEATAADICANQYEIDYNAEYKCKKALDRAANYNDSLAIVQDPYIPYDLAQALGFRGTCYAHLKSKENARQAQVMLAQGIKKLQPSESFRTLAFYKDQIIACGPENDVRQARDCAHRAMEIIVQTTAPMELQRIRAAVRDFLRKDDPLVKDLDEELQATQQNLLFV